MYLRIFPEYQRVWAVGLRQYLPTTVVIGYRSESLDGRVMAYGNTRIEAFVDGMAVLKANPLKHLTVVSQSCEKCVDDRNRERALTCLLSD